MVYRVKLSIIFYLKSLTIPIRPTIFVIGVHLIAIGHFKSLIGVIF